MTNWTNENPEEVRDAIGRYIAGMATRHEIDWAIGPWQYKGFDEPSIGVNGHPFCHLPYEPCGSAMLLIFRLLAMDGWEIQTEFNGTHLERSCIALFKTGQLDGPSHHNANPECCLWTILYELAVAP